MSAVKCVIVAVSLVLLAGCVIRDDRGGDYERGRGEFHGQGRGQEQGRGLERGGGPERGEYRYRSY
jgi:hypothetical protein